MTIAEIAVRAGVSKAAVSRYLNKGYVSSEKRESIRRVIEETGYVPMRQAQNLRTGKSRTIGVIVPRIDSESISRVVAGISHVLEQQDYHLLLANTFNRVEKELEYLEVFRSGNVDGIILVATTLSGSHKSVVHECNVPIVVLGQHMEGVSCVYHDDFGASRELTGLLLAKGRTRVGYIGVTTRDRAAGAERKRGYLAALAKAGLQARPDDMEHSDFSVEGGQAAAERLISRTPDIDALFCATDSIAVGAMRGLQERGRHIPENISLVGIGHSRLSGLVSPHLSTAHYFYQTSGEEGARMLLETLNEGIDQHKQIKLGYEIVLQQSV